jgi:hypothetical protein
MEPVPFLPVEGDGRTLEDCDEGERHAEKAAEHHGGPEKPADLPPGEDAHVEEQEREFHQRDLEEVQDLQDVEELAEVGDLVVAERPDVLAQPV